MTREEALKILETPPLTEEESKELFSEIARKLEISEEELWSYHNLPECKEQFKNNMKMRKAGIKLFEVLGIERRIRK